MKRFMSYIIFEILITSLLIGDSVANESEQSEEIKIRMKRQFLSYGGFAGFSAFPFFNMGVGHFDDEEALLYCALNLLLFLANETSGNITAVITLATHPFRSSAMAGAEIMVDGLVLIAGECHGILLCLLSGDLSGVDIMMVSVITVVSGDHGLVDKCCVIDFLKSEEIRNDTELLRHMYCSTIYDHLCGNFQKILK
uniref:Uncharacterized protein n=1 Tax=Wuchereria bancrofti TaxID=6293 RepID=A0A1I8EQ40_WUCBA